MSILSEWSRHERSTRSRKVARPEELKMDPEVRRRITGGGTLCNRKAVTNGVRIIRAREILVEQHVEEA